MGYQFIKHTLIAHFPQVLQEGTLHCACGWSTTDRDPVEVIDQWAEHVEKEWNG